MKFACKRVGALLLALMLILTAVPGLVPAASAEEVEQTNAYVLNYAPDSLTADYQYSQTYMYTTPFTVNHTVVYGDGSSYTGGNFPEIFNLINTTKLSLGGDGAYASIAAYCTDAATGIRKNTSYRRINLEDSTYYKSGAAGKIRAVILNSFPRVSVETIEANANIWLQGQGLPVINGLQSGEAILATQITIWELANADNYTINKFFDGMADLRNDYGDYLDNVADTTNVDQQETESTPQNIESLYHYLYNLNSVAPKYDAVSEASFENPVYTAVKESDGTYTITAAANINTQVGVDDALTITATCADQVQSQSVTAADRYSFTFQGLTDRVEVTLEINGYQCGGDVYLFDAEGERNVSQTLVGYDDSRLPVHGEITVTPDRVLNIFKSTSEASGKMPLANITFHIYKVATMEQLESGEVKLSAQPSETEIAAYQTAGNLIASLVTDVQGFASYNFTEHGQPDGVYMIAEQFSSATTGAVEPFFVTIPGTTEDGSGYAYTVNINPKNVTETGPDIQKDVTKLDNNSDSYDVGQTHTWIIRGGIPAGIANGQKYVITDTIDYRLTYEKGSPAVMLATKAGTELELQNNVHYVLTEGTVEKDGRTLDCFTVSLTPAGMAYAASNQGSGESTAEIRVYFKAVINENAQMGTTIPNTAHLEYTNSAGVEYKDDSDVPEVHTGGIHILKTDTSDTPLAGAIFKIAREATEAELSDTAVTKEILNVGGKELSVVFVEFHAAADMSDKKTPEVTTGEDGQAVFYGLAYGTYYLVETKAPEGYNLLTQPITVEINESSHLTKADGWENAEGEVIDNTIHVVNTKFILPETGGMGTTVFTVAGILIIGAACLLLLSNRKKKV